jgi:phosphopantetheine adenylyltransferase
MKRHTTPNDLPDPTVFEDYGRTRPVYLIVSTETEAIWKELQRVRKKHGTQHLTLFDWASILGEEYGEVCRAINEEHFNDGDLQSVYAECIQVAAVAVHMAAVIREASCE